MSDNLKTLYLNSSLTKKAIDMLMENPYFDYFEFDANFFTKEDVMQLAEDIGKIKMKVTQKGGYNNYDLSEFTGKITPIAETEKEMKQIYEQIHDLEAFKQQAIESIKPYDKLKAILNDALGVEMPTQVNKPETTSKPKQQPKQKEEVEEDDIDFDDDLDDIDDVDF